MWEAVGQIMLEAASTFETSVNFYQTTRRNHPKESLLQDITCPLKNRSSIAMFTSARHWTVSKAS
jgi:hypothetical protein